MKISETIEINGRYYPHERDTTAEDAEFERQQREAEEHQQQSEPSPEDRIAELEAALSALLEGRTS